MMISRINLKGGRLRRASVSAGFSISPAKACLVASGSII